MVKVPVGLYFSCKLLLFQSFLLMSPDDSGFYATLVAVVGLHVVPYTQERWPTRIASFSLPMTD